MSPDTYLENHILSADPMELVRMLYRGALDSTREARMRLASGEIRERSNAINRALAILAELNASLDHHAGGEISANLAALYHYMRERLMEGNLQQIDAPLGETETLLETLTDAWQKADAALPERAGEQALPFQVYGAEPGRECHMWSA